MRPTPSPKAVPERAGRDAPQDRDGSPRRWSRPARTARRPGHWVTNLILLALAASACAEPGEDLAFTGTPSRSVAAGDEWVYSLEAHGSQAPISYRLVRGPEAATLHSTGELRWAPGQADLGSHRFTIEADDGSRKARQSFDLRVHQDLDLGITLSPRGHTQSGHDEDFVAHLLNHQAWGRVVAFHTHWRDTPTSAGEIPTLAATAGLSAELYGFALAAGFSWTDGQGTPDLGSGSDPQDDSWSNPDSRQAFLGMIGDFAAAYQPAYLFLGHETNSFWATQPPEEWSAWLEVLTEAVRLVRLRSPETLVGTGFQYERLLGLHPWNEEPQLQLLEEVRSTGVDALAITSFPYFAFDSPDELPGDYYRPLRTHWQGSVFFCEIGWLAAPSPPYPGGTQDQARFVKRFFELIWELDVDYATWLFLHDWDGQDDLREFANIGLRDNLGSDVRPADAAWQAAVRLRQR